MPDLDDPADDETDLPEEKLLPESLAQTFQDQLLEESPPRAFATSSERHKDADCFIRSFANTVANQLASRPPESILLDLAAFAALFSELLHEPRRSSTSPTLRQPSPTLLPRLQIRPLSISVVILELDDMFATPFAGQWLPIPAACRGPTNRTLRA